MQNQQPTTHYHRHPHNQTPHQYHRQHHHVQQHPPAEKVVRMVRQSRRAILGNYITVIAFGYLSYFSFINVSTSSALVQFAWFFGLVALVALIYSEITIHYKRLIITNKRAILHEGILKKHHITIRYSTITEVITTQRFYQRILNYGNVVIRTSGMKHDQDLKIDLVSNPFYVKKLLEHYMLNQHNI